MNAQSSFRVGAVITLIAAVFLIHGCSDDATGPTDIDPAPIADAVDGVTTSMDENEALRSLNAVGDLFGGAMGGTSLVAPTESGSTSLASGLETLTLQAAAVMQSGHSAHLFSVIPEEVLGTTFEYDAGEGNYVPSDRTGAPTNGVRFILYAVDPVTGELILETEIGWVDLLDTSSSSSNRLRIVVVSGGETFIDYEVSCALSSSTLALTGSGYVTDGETQANLSLSLSFSQSGTVTFDFDVQVPSENLTVSFDATGTSSTDLSATFSVTRGSNTIAFTVSLEGEAIDGQVTINGGTVAVISGTASAPVVTDAGGNELGPDARENLARLFIGAGAATEHLLGLLTPAFEVCF